MNKHNQKNFFQKHRLLTFTLILFFVLLPLLVIPTVYAANALTNQTVLFEDKSLKVTAKQEVFDLEFQLQEIIEPDEKNEGGKYIFSYEITPKETVNTIKVNKINGQLSIRNDSYNSKAEKELTIIKTTPTTRLVIPFNYNLDKTILPFVKPDGPYLYIKIDYTETVAGLSQSTNHTLIIKVTYDDSLTIVRPQ